MFRKRFVFTLVGEKDLVDIAATEVKNIITDLTNRPVNIISADKSPS